jgi:glutathione peroxidase
MGKVDVNGDNANGFWKWLKQKKPGLLGFEGIKWNFTKFLLDSSGHVVERYGPNTSPESIAADIEKLVTK